MSRRAVIFVVGVVALGAIWVALERLTPSPVPPATSRESTPAPAPARVDAPEPAPAPAVGPDAARRPTRRAAAPKAEAAPAAPEPDAGDLATVRIDTDVPGASVFIDRQFIGQAPATAERVRPGSHRVNVAAPGYEGVAETIDVTPGRRDLVVRLKEVRLDAALDVVHKHRFGSCKGRLSATPQGVRYEASDKGDAFTITLADLEVLDVDYLKKNLKLKIRKGRQYDFTDPDGNADRLFVFQRDVTKATEKTKAAGREP